MHAYVQKLSAKINKLKAKTYNAEDESRLEYQKEIENLKQRRKDAEEKLTEFRHAREGARQDLKSGAKNARDAMEKALTSAEHKFK